MRMQHSLKVYMNWTIYSQPSLNNTILMLAIDPWILLIYLAKCKLMRQSWEKTPLTTKTRQDNKTTKG